ncbi:hypothetical protein ABPG77_010984 [Micractinium sp. CCAP 211/92]
MLGLLPATTKRWSQYVGPLERLKISVDQPAGNNGTLEVWSSQNYPPTTNASCVREDKFTGPSGDIILSVSNYTTYFFRFGDNGTNSTATLHLEEYVPSPPPPPRHSPPPRRPPPRPSPPRPRPPPPPVQRDAGGITTAALTLKCTGFDGSSFDYSVAPGAWRQLIGSAGQGFSLKTQYGANSRDPSSAVQRALEFRSGKNTVVVSLNGSAAKGWALSATANSKPVVSSASLPNGVDVKVVRFDPPANGVKSRVIVDAGFARLVMSQRWDDKKGMEADFLNFGLTLVGPLKLPVSGILGPSYTAALRRARSAAGVAAAVAKPLSAAGGN